ncbi:MAG: acetyl-CoA carboxylase biotin carboxyl carrier protein [Acidobacteria bacterium]|nr:acetyl-CoA carboxylase biotin carboxyl carrier protein [Acidobacteriota bacterium]
MKKSEPRTKHAANQSAGASSNSTGTGHYPSHAEIKELIELISEKKFSEFELVLGGFRLYLLNSTGTVAATVASSPSPVSDSITDHNSIQSAPAAIQPVPVASAAPAPEEEQLQIVTSPIVGTFYRSPSPESDPFVDLGDQVERGQILCIIEAMKLMNEIPSEASGTIAKVFVENGQAVEYGQPLFGIK